MPSPDATTYVDLILIDLDPQELFDIAVDVAKTRFPELVMRETMMETVAFEAMSVQVAEAVHAINRVPSSVVAIFMRMLGIEYDQGAQPIAVLQFDFNSDAGLTIPAGTSATYQLSDDLLPIVYTIPTDVIVPAGTSTVTTGAVGDRFTADANNVTGQPILTLNDSLIFVNSVTLVSSTGGRDPEDDEEFFTRGTQRFRRMSDALLTPNQFDALVQEQVYVERVAVLDNYNPDNDTDNNGPLGNDPGHITIAVYGDNANLTNAQKQTLLDLITPMAASNLAIHLINPTITPVDVTANVLPDIGYSASDVVANVTAALNEYLSRQNWNWSSKVRRNELIRVIGNATGVAYVNTLTTPAADVTLPGVARLTTPGVFNITAG